MGTENSAIVKIIAKRTREYLALDSLYKKLGAKHLTLLVVHKKTLEKMAKFESKHHDLKEEHAIVVERAVTVKQLYTQAKGENKKLKVLLQVAKDEAKKQREEFLDDLKGCRYGDMMARIYETEKKWEAK